MRGIDDWADKIDTMNKELKEKDESLEDLNEGSTIINEEFKTSQEKKEYQQRKLETYSRLIKRLNSEIELDELIEKMLNGLMELTSSQFGVVYLYENEGETLNLHTLYGIVGEDGERIEVSEESARKRCHVGVDKIKEFQECGISAVDGRIFSRSILSIPVVYRDELLAVVRLGSVDALDKDLMGLLEDFASHLATAIKNSNVHDYIQEYPIRMDGLNASVCRIGEGENPKREKGVVYL